MRKKIHRFFIATIPDEGVFSLHDSAIAHHIRSVLRLAIGEEILLFTNRSADQLVTITTITKEAIVVEKNRTLPLIEAPKRTVTAVVSIIKTDKFELVVQKLTELGITTIVPLIADRSVKQTIRPDRLHTISKEALEQCGGNTLVTIAEPLKLRECLNTYSNTASFVCLPDANAPRVSLSNEPVTFYIGPEGGWSEAEEKLFEEYRVTPLNLGPRILRAETAAIVGAYTLLN